MRQLASEGLASEGRYPNKMDRIDKFGVGDAEREVEAEMVEHSTQQRTEEDVEMEDDKDRSRDQVPSFTGFSFPALPASSSATSALASSSRTTPTRRRSGAPTSIPNFPSATEHRGKENSPYSPRSPTGSPKASSPNSPGTPRNGGLNIPNQIFSTPGGSPWLALAESSGAPTPSLHGPGRSSPHLGGPFEKLNIGSSWSGSNLWGSDNTGRRGSTDSSSSPSILTQTTLSSPPSQMGLAGGLSSDTLAKYRAMAGKASASGLKGKSKESASTSDLRGSPPIHSLSPTKSLSLPPALAKRRASIPKNVLDNLNPPTTYPVKSPSPLAAEATLDSPSPPAKLQPIQASSAKKLLDRNKTLLLDLRPPSAYQALHIPSAHSLPIPSTLIRRPAFNLTKLVNMLAPPSTAAVAKWKDMKDIILLDLDSMNAVDGSLLEGLGGKFEREGYQGHLWFVQGGHNALQHLGVEMVTDEMNGEVSGSDAGQGPSRSMESKSVPTGGLLAGGLGKFAFQSGSTGSGRGSSRSGSIGDLPAQTPGLAMKLDPFGSALNFGSGSSERLDIGSLSRGLKSGSEVSLGGSNASFQSGSGLDTSATRARMAKLQPANPFFDNIRQNLELSHGGITERIPLGLPAEVKKRAAELPGWLSDIVGATEDQGAERLALQFYDIEVGEQKRLQSVMDWHTKGSGTMANDSRESSPPDEQKRKDNDEVERLGAGGDCHVEDDPKYFPFSITAGVERGTKNRYKNIWPYDFSRVRLGTPAEGDTDYINASFVQPRGTGRRYIATQGPLDATYRDFWTLIWEQDVRVIVMLTKQFEGGLLKCGNYWQDTRYGPLHLRLVEQSGGEDVVAETVTGFDFGMAATTPKGAEELEGASNIRRVFLLSHEGYPHEAPRRIVQIQCVAWPDFDVPRSPEVLLSLIRETDQAMTEVGPTDDRSDCPPVLVHCSAGVGRTGSFIVVDAVIDGMRREANSVKEFVELESNLGNSRPDGDSEYSLEPRNRLSDSPFSRDSSRASGSPFESGNSGTEITNVTGAIKHAVSSHQLRSQSGSSHASRGGSKSVSFINLPDSQLSGPSFLFPNPDSTSGPGTYPYTFSTSPVPMAPTLAPPVSGDTASSSESTSGATFRGEEMEVDQPKSPVLDERFTKHRGSVAYSTTSSEGDFLRRPSMTESSLDRLDRDFSAHSDLPQSSKLANRGERHRTPSPLSEMENPIASVLEGMRVQRMSLVQTLRQFVFVYRAIIHHYLSQTDEDFERDIAKEPYSAVESNRRHHSRHGTGYSNAYNSADEEGPPKRRASPEESAVAAVSRRASVKRMRPEKGDHTSDAAKGSSDSVVSPDAPVPNLSMSSVLARRRGSKLGLK